MDDGTDSAQVVTPVGQTSGPSNDATTNGEVPYPITPHPGNTKPARGLLFDGIARQKTMYKVKLLGINDE